MSPSNEQVVCVFTGEGMTFRSCAPIPPGVSHCRMPLYFFTVAEVYNRARMRAVRLVKTVMRTFYSCGRKKTCVGRIHALIRSPVSDPCTGPSSEPVQHTCPNPGTGPGELDPVTYPSQIQAHV